MKKNEGKSHRSQVEFECRECGTKFTSSRKFDRHQLDHELEATEPTGINYICFTCGARFDFLKELLDHVRKDHINKDH